MDDTNMAGGNPSGGMSGGSGASGMSGGMSDGEMGGSGSGGMSGGYESGSMSGGMSGSSSGDMGDDEMTRGGPKGGTGGTTEQRMISKREFRQMFETKGTGVSREVREALRALLDAAENDPQAQEDEATRGRRESTFIYDCFVYTCTREF